MKILRSCPLIIDKNSKMMVLYICDFIDADYLAFSTFMLVFLSAFNCRRNTDTVIHHAYRRRSKKCLFFSVER